MWNVKKREEIAISKKEAQELETFNTYDAQRPLNQKHLEQLKRAIENDIFRTGHIAMAILKDKKGKKYKILVNGQHQLRAVIETDKAIIANYEEIECETWEDVAEVYTTFDQGGRLFYDLIDPYAKALGISWPSLFTKLVLIGGLYKDGRQTWDRTRKVSYLKEYVKAGKAIYSMLQTNGKIEWKDLAHIKRRAVFAAIMATSEKNEDDAKRFWKEVFYGENLKRESPSKLLRDFLMTFTIDSGRGSRQGKKASEKDVYRKCVLGWNAFRRGETTKLKIFNGNVPKVI